MAMALDERRGSESGSDDPEELEALEAQVEQMAEKLLELRSTLPDQLKNTFASVLAAQQPVLPGGSDPGTSAPPNSDAGQVANKGASLAGGDQTSEKMQLFKDKLSSNVAALPIILKRMKECISRIDKSNPQELVIHPAFKRKRTR